MKLNLQQLRPAILGAARVGEESDGIRFYRFTAKQETVYRTNHPDFYQKSLATAGVQICFATDSTALNLALTYFKGSSRPFAVTDVFCNGKMIGRIGSGDAADGRFEKCFWLGDGKKDVRIVFPWSSATVLRALELDDGCSFQPLSRARNMLLFGDSITQGYDARYPSHSFASVLAELLHADARNKGIGGEQFNPALIDEEEAAHSEIIVVAFGTNDWAGKQLPDAIREKVSRFFGTLAACAPKTVVFAVTPIWRGDEYSLRSDMPFSDVAQIIRERTAAFGNVGVIDGFGLVPHDPSLFSPDILHPNDAGNAFYAERLYRKINEKMQELQNDG